MPAAPPHPPPSERAPERVWLLFGIFLRLGLIAFGGPVAHLGYFREEFVHRRRWLDEASYADLVALCQFLPGPASSQVGLALGLLRGGYRGSLAAWAGFTLPSALAMTLFGLTLGYANNPLHVGVLHGLELVAVAVVALVVLNMARTLCPDLPRRVIAGFAAIAALSMPGAWVQLGIIATAAAIGASGLRASRPTQANTMHHAGSHRVALSCLLAFFALLLALPVLASLSGLQGLALIDSFYRTGALVFGGGHVVLPMLQAEVVPHGWVSEDSFLAGYGAAQAVPGPLFSFAAFLGAAMHDGLAGLGTAGLCLLTIFLPSFLLVFGVLPFWSRLRAARSAQAALAGVNAAVVGLLLAALYDPLWTHSVASAGDVIFILIALLALHLGRLPPWLVVVLGALAGSLLEGR